MKLSVVVATYNRVPLLERLLRQLGEQTLSPKEFEVVVVDDGSRESVASALSSFKAPYAFSVLEQANQGAAMARHRGAMAAKGEILLITDDDMQVPKNFLENHLLEHEGGERHVVLGRIRPDPQLHDMPIFERWYAYRLAKMAQGFRDGSIQLRGGHLFTGNVSMRREDYVAVGGFNPELKRSEDLELGLRLEKAGVKVVFAESAYTLHGSDHTSLETWLRRAFLYGVFDSKIHDKHPDLPQASPWRFLFRLHPAARPLLLFAVAAPRLSKPVSELAWLTIQAADKVGLEKAAFAGSSIMYQMEYYRGVRHEAGSLRQTFKDLTRYVRESSRA